jgi:predicted ArsR family transcriptional regulator
MTVSWQFANTPAARVLKAVQLRGRASIKDVAGDLDVTPSAVRMHLAQLQASGAVQADKVREGVGRPHYVYSLTAEGHSLFRRDYGELAKLLLDEVTQARGSDSLQDVLRRLSARMAETYRDRVLGQDLAARLQAWAELLDERGVAAQIQPTEAGYVLREYGCPYHNVALENRAVCELERQVMTQLLESGVELSHCVLDGHHGCQFIITDGS